MPRIPLPSDAYQAAAPRLSNQRLVNLFPEAAPPGAANEFWLRSVPGLKRFATLGDGPVRGGHLLGGRPYFVSGESLYRLDPDGSHKEIPGRIPGSDPVCMTANRTQLAIVAKPDGFVYTAAAGLAPISDPDWPGAGTCAFMDQYGIFTVPDTGRFFVSDLADLSAYDALDIATAEAAPDNIVRVFVEKRQVFLFGETTTEVWFNAGDASFPFERLPGGIMERGILSPLAVARQDNTLFWLGEDGVVYRANGYTPQRVSQHGVEEAIRGYADKRARAFSYTLAGHRFVGFRFAAGTWVLDLATGRWHERQTYGAETFEAAATVFAYGRPLIGDTRNGRIYAIDPGSYDDDGAVLRRSARFPPIGDGETPRTLAALEIEFEAGVGATGGQGSDPQAMLRWSDDGGRTWSNERWRSIGAKGRYGRRAVWNGLGRFRRRVLELSLTDPVNLAIVDAYGR